MPIFQLPDSLSLESGKVLENVEIHYEMVGEPIDGGSNVIVICHTLTGGINIVDSPLWSFVGEGQLIDTDQYCIISLGTLGGVNESTGPLSCSPSGEPYGPDFPVVTVVDSVKAHNRVLDALGIYQAKAIIGGSYGGFCAYAWLALKPSFFDLAVIFQSALRCSAHTIALWALCRDLITSDARWRNGRYTEKDFQEMHGFTQMIALNRILQLGHEKFESKFPSSTRLETQDLTADFWDKHCAIDDFLLMKPGKTLVNHKSLDPNTILSTLRSSSLFDLERSFPDLWTRWKNLSTTIIQLPCVQDWRYPTREMHQLHRQFKQVGVDAYYRPTSSQFGHGSFLYDPKSLKIAIPLLERFFRDCN